MTDPVLIDPPAALVTPEEVKAHLHIDGDEEDALIELHIAAAVSWLDGWRGVLGRCILTQRWASFAPQLRDMALPFPDPQSAVVSYLDAAGDVQTVDAAQYRVRTRRGVGELVLAGDFVAPQVLAGRDDAVTVTAIYGQDEAPAALRAAVLALVGHRLKYREGVEDEIPASVIAMVRSYRVVGCG